MILKHFYYLSQKIGFDISFGENKYEMSTSIFWAI